MDYKKTIIYIDGFNLFHRSLKNTPFKWLDFKLLFSKILPNNYKIDKIKYFTAKVSGLGDVNRPQRQATYIRALSSHIPEFEVYYGKFMSHKTKMPLANKNYPKDSKDIYFRKRDGRLLFKNVVKIEEKGSDVNLAVHILNDAWLNIYDCAVLVSNDSDIAGALSLIKEEHPSKQRCWILPFDAESFRAQREGRRIIKGRSLKPSQELRKQVDHTWKIRLNNLRTSQLPNIIPGTNISKPLSWNEGYIYEYLFQRKGLDSGLIISKLIEKNYVNNELRVNSSFSFLDNEFKRNFPQYTDDQFNDIQTILLKSIDCL